jgi:hypothetical protein
VARLRRWPLGITRNLVVVVARVGESSRGHRQHVGSRVIGGKRRNACAVQRTKARPLVQLEVVRRNVLGLERDGACQRATPGVQRLAREPADEVDRDVVKACAAQERHCIVYVRAPMCATTRRQQVVVEALGADAGAVDASTAERGRFCRVKRGWVHLTRYLRIGVDAKRVVNAREQPVQVYGRDQARRPAAQVHRRQRLARATGVGPRCRRYFCEQ